MSKRRSYLDVDWVELGCRGWDIDATGAEAADLDPTETMYCHLDRTTLDIILCGDAQWCAARLSDLAEARVPGLEQFKMWRIPATTGGQITCNPSGAMLYYGGVP